MTYKEKCKYILRKFAYCKYSRPAFFWRYLEEFYGVKFYITKEQFFEFWKDEAAIERALRDILKEKEFKLEPEQDSKRYEKAAAIKEEYKTKG